MHIHAEIYFNYEHNMYKTYAFWRKSTSLNKVNHEVENEHGNRPIIINNTQTILLSNDNIKAFLNEGERAKLEQLVEQSEHIQGMKKETAEVNTKPQKPHTDTETMNNESSKMNSKNASLNNDKKMEKLEDIKGVINKYSKILSVFSRFDIKKLELVVQHMTKLYTDWKDELEDITFDLKIIEQLAIMLQHYKDEENEMAEIFNPTEKYKHSLVEGILVFISFVTDSSVSYSKATIRAGLIEYCASMMKCYHPLYMTQPDNQNMIRLLTNLMSVIHNCIMHVPEERKYEEQNIKQLVEVYLSSNVIVLRVVSIMITSALISEDENTNIEHTDSIPYMVDIFVQAVSSEDKRCYGFNIPELLDCLVRIAANDSNKLKIIEANVLPSLVTTLKDGADKEQLMAAKLIWVLCFDKDAKTKVTEEPGCLDALKELLNCDNSKIKRMVQGALWKINGEKLYHEKQKLQLVEELTDVKENQKHIFISYQWDHQNVVLKIKETLKKNGYKVWIDVEQMGGSTLEAMANAVENAEVVLICASEKYKLSPNCRTEAEYVFQIKKPIVPLMLQRYYKPDGWLGMLLGAKFFINFDGKFEFDYAFGLLQTELQRFTHISDTANDVTKDVGDGDVLRNANSMSSKASVHGSSSKQKLAQWSNQQVKEWIEQNNLNGLNNELQAVFAKMDGDMLMHILELKKEAPEFFYKELKNYYALDLLGIIQLNKAFDALLQVT